MRLFLLLAVSSLIGLVAAQTKDDENRPYKFGFNIEGHQHRKEEKDEKGIIRGEYGFITADGYYRVTVYETDEQGRFKIISQKNYYVGFPPGDPTPPPNAIKSSTPSTSTVGKLITILTSTTKPKVSSKLPNGGASCGSCLLPSKSTFTPKQPGFITPVPVSSTTTKPLTKIPKPDFTTTPKLGFTTTPKPDDTETTNFRDLILVKSAPVYKNEPDPPQTFFPNNITKKPATVPIPSTPQFPNSRVITNKEQPPENNTPIDPQEANKLRYKFNYTVGFHGHHETGYQNGDKTGDYFVNSRDGVSRRVDYIANEFGYQPNITLTKLPENDSRIPNKDTEKSFGLKGYEFKWF